MLRGRLCCQTPVDNILTGFESVNFIQRENSPSSESLDG